MTPVRQTKLYSKDGIHNGNCLAACLASLLDLPLWMVPPFEEMFAREDWALRIDEWLRRTRGLELETVYDHSVDSLPEFYIACGRSARGVMHAVIYSKGEMVHDPHYSDGGIDSVEYVRYLAPVQP